MAASSGLIRAALGSRAPRDKEQHPAKACPCWRHPPLGEAYPIAPTPCRRRPAGRQRSPPAIKAKQKSAAPQAKTRAESGPPLGAASRARRSEMLAVGGKVVARVRACIMVGGADKAPKRDLLEPEGG